MALGSKELATDQLDGFDKDRLVEELRRAKEELFNLRFQSATGQLESHGRLRSVKRDIAWIYTILRERELGLRPEVVAPVEEAKPAKAEKPKKAKKASTKEEPSVDTEASEEDAK